jgi:L,D-transpeptidase YcbB
MRALLTVCLAVAVLTAASCRDVPSSTPELQALLAGKRAPTGVQAAVWEDTARFYTERGATLAWVNSRGASERTSRALDALAAAADHGLDPADYDEPVLRQAAAAIGSLAQNERAEALAHLDVRITAHLLRLGRDVGTGRLLPKVIDPRWNTRREPPDVVAALQSAVDTPASFLEAVQPVHPEYRALKSALGAMRAQAPAEWPRMPAATLKLGQWNPAVETLRQRLSASGHLRAGAPLDSAHFDADVEAALKGFQTHHGLPATGVLDRVTIERMNVPRDVRLRQLAINLERWRLLPDDLGARHFLVNVPHFHLFAREEGRTVLDMRVVVGKRGNETPLFSDEMETVVFSPYWNVPDTIALEETAPAVARDPEFLARNNMEVLNAAGQVVAADDIPWGDEGLLAGYRFRQRPGANNALGYVKFLFPNEHAVYFHDTPADALFKRIGRAFSHGCVRLEEPEVLAAYVLRDRPDWTGDAIRTAMRAGTERPVQLGAKIPAHIVYFTAWVDEHGGLHFEDDVYGYDMRQARQ